MMTDINDIVLEDAIDDKDLMMEFFGFNRGPQSTAPPHMKGAFEIEFNACANDARSKIKRTSNYAKAVAARGNEWVNQRVDEVIDRKKHECLNKLARGVAKTIIVATLVTALLAAIVVPGGGIAAAAGAAKLSSSAGGVAKASFAI